LKQKLGENAHEKSTKAEHLLLLLLLFFEGIIPG